MAVAFAIFYFFIFLFFFFMADIETKILSKSVTKPTIWKRCIDDTFSLWDVCKHTRNQQVHRGRELHFNQSTHPG